MAIIKKKIPPEYFDLVNSGKKNFELRVAEFDANEGDILILEEWDPNTKEYTGRKIEREISYVLNFGLNTFGQEELIKEKGLIVLGLKNNNRNDSISLGVINRDVFDKENSLCQKHFKNKGHCCWGTCDKCGVPLLLHKLYKGEVVDKEEDINRIKGRLFQ